MATINSPRATGRLKGKVDPWYAEGVAVVCGIGADESDCDEIVMDIVNNNSLHAFTNSSILATGPGGASGHRNRGRVM